LASQADLWLQIRPGTDAALALGMMKIIIDEGLYDRDFVTKWCYGFDQLKQRVKEYPLSKVSEITWIPAEKILQAARDYATIKPAVLHRRVAIEHNINSTQTCRSFAILIALTGNIDVPGGNLLQSPMQTMRRLNVPPDIAAKRLGAKRLSINIGSRGTHALCCGSSIS